MKRALFIGLFLIFSGIIFGPLLVTAAWHLRHGNFSMLRLSRLLCFLFGVR